MSRRKKDKKDDYYMLRVKLSKEDHELLKEKCKIRGLDQSNYIREKIRETNNNLYFSIPVRNGLNNISAGTCILRNEELSEYGKQALEFIETGVRQLWQYSR